MGRRLVHEDPSALCSECQDSGILKFGFYTRKCGCQLK